MKTLRAGLVLLVALAVGLKLFTYEYFFADDPTVGIALRSVPGLESRRQISPTTEKWRDHHVLIADENDFPGSGIYRFIVQIGWVVGLSALAIAGFMAAKQQRRRSGL